MKYSYTNTKSKWSHGMPWDDHSRCLEAVKQKNWNIEWITKELATADGPLVFGSLDHQNPRHRDSMSLLATHFLRQVLQRCPKKDLWAPNLKRLMTVEAKEVEGVGDHLHFIMEAPSTMTVQDFCRLCETRWISIATRDLWATKPHLALPNDQAAIVYSRLAHVTPVMEEKGGLSGAVKYVLKWIHLNQDEGRPDRCGRILLEPRPQVTNNGHSVQHTLL